MKDIVIGSDHGGFELKEDLKKYLEQLGYNVNDQGPKDENSVDYPDYGITLAEAISTGRYKKGILVCGTGIGMSIVVNKFPNVRGALCGDIFSSRLSRLHNDANIIILGGRVTGKGLAREMVETWLKTEFEGGRHQVRLDKIKKLEKDLMKGESK
ncbi:MAG: ribose 5-phosphate isomerase B [Nitrospinota bacterium]